MKRVDFADLGGGSVLAGVALGQSVFRKLLENLPADPPTEPESLFLDFRDVDVATGSFVRESVFAFRDHIRGRRSTYYPIVANANVVVREELLNIVRSGSGPILVCTLSREGVPGNLTVIGTLEPKQQLAFDEVTQRGETDAGQLMIESVDKEIKHATAWNNRLSSLAAFGLVIEVSRGRTKRYRSLVEEA